MGWLSFFTGSSSFFVLMEGANPFKNDYRSLHPVDLPTDGIILTTKLAEILGVTPDDRLTAEVLEGARPIREATVASLVDELVGLSAYMDLSAVNRLMQEGESLSGAYLAVDARQTKLYRFPLVISKASYGFAFVVVAIAALFSGLLVRRQLDRLDLIAVLKTRE
jgi:ABC-type antimicrobial peptide transport system permease subunit